MSNLLTVLPDFDPAPYDHILPSLERALVSTADLITLDVVDVAKRAQVPPREVKRLTDAVLHALHGHLAGPNGVDPRRRHLGASQPDDGRSLGAISTLDDALDAALGGGIALGHLTEVVGESAAGKTQFLLTLLLSAQLCPAGSPPTEHNLTSALYISTEAPLQTSRLTQILQEHPKLSCLPKSLRPSLHRVQSTQVHDVEAQEHILRYQVPVAVKKHNVKLVVIDSIAANYRAEFDKNTKPRKSAESLARRSSQITKMGTLLRDFARSYNVAFVVANQVADRFSAWEPNLPSQHRLSQDNRPRSVVSPRRHTDKDITVVLPRLSTDDPLALDYQQQFFTGWGDDSTIMHMKTPSLGLAWTNQLSTRIALLREPIYEDRSYPPGADRNVVGWRRVCKTVFSAWCAESVETFEIWTGGIRATPTVSSTDQKS